MVDRDVIVSAIEDATYASSIHNCQPWRFAIDGDAVTIRLDASGTPRTVDPAGRWALASMGAVLANLEVALAARTGRATATELLVADSIPEGELAGGVAFADRPLAVVRVTEEELGAEAKEKVVRLTGVIRDRFTTREPLTGGAPSPGEWAALRRVVTEVTDEVGVAVASNALALTLLQLTAAAEVASQDDPDYLAELEEFVQDGSSTGLPRQAVGLPDAEGRVPTRDFTQTPMGSAATGEATFFEAEPALLVIGTEGDTPREQFLAGYSMQRAMLEATALGLGIGVLGQALEADESRDAVREAVSDSLERPVVVHQILRLGHPAGTLTHPRTPRRPVAEVILN